MSEESERRKVRDDSTNGKSKRENSAKENRPRVQGSSSFLPSCTLLYISVFTVALSEAR